MIACCDNVMTVQILRPWKSFVKELLKTFECHDATRFNQWVSTDRRQLVEQESIIDDFVDDLVEKFLKLIEHHYIAKQRSEFFKRNKNKFQIWGVCYCSWVCRKLPILGSRCCPRFPLEQFPGYHSSFCHLLCKCSQWYLAQILCMHKWS